ncbi:hypothetical protein Ciccas_013922, partial [Cichlidogyrus casuarinus]
MDYKDLMHVDKITNKMVSKAYLSLLLLIGGCLAFDPKPQDCELGQKPTYMLTYQNPGTADEITEIRSERLNFLLVYKNTDHSADSLVSIGSNDHNFKFITPLSIQYKMDQGTRVAQSCKPITYKENDDKCKETLFEKLAPLRDMGAWTKDPTTSRVCFQSVDYSKKVCVKEGDSGACLLENYYEKRVELFRFTQIDIPRNDDQLNTFNTETVKNFT